MNINDQMEVVEADITHLVVDAIVNAANESLLGGSGVDGAIHRAAGPGLLQECKKLQGCPTGEAKITQGHNLPSKHVIHTVGPIWRGGNQREAELLASCYRCSLELALAHKLTTVAFPAISTGVYHFPATQAAMIAVSTVVDVLVQNPSLKKITFCCFGETSADLHRKAIAAL